MLLVYLHEDMLLVRIPTNVGNGWLFIDAAVQKWSGIRR